MRCKSFLFGLFSLFSITVFGQGSGTMLDFDGTGTDYVDVDSAFSEMQFPFSFATWYSPNAPINVTQPLFASSDGSTVSQGWWIDLTSSGLNASIGNGNGAGAGSTTTAQVSLGTLQANAWYHIAVVFRNYNSIEVYLNGNALMVSYPNLGATSIGNAKSSGTIGFRSDAGVPFYLDGLLDEMSIWTKALSLTDIRDFMCKSLTGLETDLEAYYRFDDVLGNTLTDYGPNGYHGDVYGAGWVNSQAPVGDRSYWTHSGTTLTGFSPNGDVATVNMIGSGDNGIHLYFIDRLPFPVPNDPIPGSVNHYFGVFLSDYSNTYDLTYVIQPPLVINNVYGLSRRPDNASTSWTDQVVRNNPDINLAGRMPPEQFVIITDCEDRDFVPRDTAVCDSAVIDLGANLTNVIWMDGSSATNRVFNQNIYAWFYAEDAITGCPYNDTIEVTVVDQGYQILPDDTLICHSPNLELNAFINGAIAYQWSNGGSNESINVTGTDLYWVEVFMDGGCSFRDSVRVTFSEAIDPVAEDEFNICDGESVTIDIDQIQFIGVNWSDGTSGYSTTYTNPGVHWVEAIKLDGCTEYDTFSINIAPVLDSLDFFKDTLFCVDEPFWISAPDTLEVVWPNGSDSIYYVNGTQTVRVELYNGCSELVEYFDAEEYNCTCDVKMANAFTPNNDNLNDVFVPIGDCIFTEYNLRVFNRWGSLVFETKTAGEGFDGTFEGEKLPQGIYLYRFSYRTDRTAGGRKGSFTLIR